MKILIINTLYYPYKIGGAEVSVQILAEELVRSGHVVRIITLHNNKKRMEKEINGVTVIYLPLINIYWPFEHKRHNILTKFFWHILDSYNIPMGRMLEKELNLFMPDIAHTNNLQGFSVLVWKVLSERKIKIVHTSRDYYLFHPNATLFNNKKKYNIEAGSFKVKLFSFVKKYLSKYVDEYVGISDFIKDLHINNGFFKNAKSSRIYNPIDAIPISKKLVKFNELNIGFIGRLTVEKGFDNFCEIARLNPKFNFYAAGKFSSSNLGDDLKARCKKLHINILGFVNLTDFLDKVDVVIFPINWNEPFGRAAVECALSGKLVFVSMRGGLIELSKIIPNLLPLDNNFKMDLEMIKYYFSLENNYVFEDFSRGNIIKSYLSIYK